MRSDSTENQCDVLRCLSDESQRQNEAANEISSARELSVTILAKKKQQKKNSPPALASLPPSSGIEEFNFWLPMSNLLTLAVKW